MMQGGRQPVQRPGGDGSLFVGVHQLLMGMQGGYQECPCCCYMPDAQTVQAHPIRKAIAAIPDVHWSICSMTAASPLMFTDVL